MPGRVRQKKLLGRGSVTADMKKNATDTVGSMDNRLIDGTGLVSMFVGHLESVVGKFVKTVACPLRMTGRRSYLLVTDIDPCPETGEVDIDPIGILRHGIEKAAVLDYVGIHRILKAK